MEGGQVQLPIRLFGIRVDVSAILSSGVSVASSNRNKSFNSNTGMNKIDHTAVLSMLLGWRYVCVCGDARVSVVCATSRCVRVWLLCVQSKERRV